MMNFTWPSLKSTNWDTTLWIQSKAMPGVTFAIRRVSLGERIALTTNIREMLRKQEFLRSGNEDEQLEAALGDLLLKAAYLDWGLLQVRGLAIDHSRASAQDVIRNGPEPLIDEILAAIKGELGLSEEERKNS